MMTIFGLNSPELFLILVITLVILGVKRIEKGLDLLSRLLKFLLNNQSSIDKKDKKKDQIKDIEETQKKKADVTKIEQKPNAKEKGPTKVIEETEGKVEEITKIEEKPNAEYKESINDIEETQEK